MKAAGALNGRCKYKIVPDQLLRMARILDIDVKMQDSPQLALLEENDRPQGQRGNTFQHRFTYKLQI